MFSMHNKIMLPSVNLYISVLIVNFALINNKTLISLMLRTFIACAAIICSLAAVAAKGQRITLWPDGAPNSNHHELSAEEMRGRNALNDPAMTLYLAAEPAGKTVIVCPGGGYGHLAVGHEGHDMADWFNRQGVNLAVLQYRLPFECDDVPLSDVQQAFRILRDRLPGEKIGVMGFSAGGHLASTAATHYTDSLTRPDFQILIYPVITMDGPYVNDGTKINLIGHNPSPEKIDLYSNERHVTANTPQAFLAHCADDKAVRVNDSLDYAAQLAAAGVDVTLLVYPRGGHGWGFRNSFKYKPMWTAELENWLRNI